MMSAWIALSFILMLMSVIREIHISQLKNQIAVLESAIRRGVCCHSLEQKLSVPAKRDSESQG